MCLRNREKASVSGAKGAMVRVELREVGRGKIMPVLESNEPLVGLNMGMVRFDLHFQRIALAAEWRTDWRWGVEAEALPGGHCSHQGKRW